MIDHFKTLARYNGWANHRLGTAVAALDADAYFADRGAFFGSIHGTLNHILLVDRLWRGRLIGALYPIDGLDDQVAADRETYLTLRAEEDQILIDFVDGVSEATLSQDVGYTTTTGEVCSTPICLVLTHMFNHATHHRGQVHGLLSQVPSDPPPLDLVFYLRDNEKIN